MVSEKLNTAIAVIQSGDTATGARLLKEILHDDPSNEKAWIWLSACVDKNDQKVYCLNMALSINPTNSLVAKALSHLELPRQPAAEETVPEYMKELSSSLETQAPYEDKSEIIEPLGKPVINPNVTSHHAKVPLKSTNKIKEKYIVILGISLVLVLCVILFIVFLIKESDFIGNMNILDTSTAFTEADAVRVVQNWKAPSNMGITCQEVFDEIVYVYNNNLDISEAEVKWSAVKQSEFVFIVHANLRGETGWANYRWQVKFPDEEIISLGDMHICASLDNTTNHIFINTPIFQNNLDITTSTPIPRENFGLATNTPANTQEPISASEPIVITGSGNSIVSIDKWDGPALIHITGSPSANSFFSVRSDNGLFYASDFYQYDGVKLLDIFPGSTTQSFEIEAEGEWSIEIHPLQSEFFNERSLNAPEIYQGNNDDVLFINGGEYQISVEGNSANTNFIIWTHGEFGESYFMNFDLILNVSEPYDGIIDLPEWVRILEIEAVGPWTIEINNR